MERIVIVAGNFLQAFVENFSCRSDKRLSREIFTVTRLLAHNDHLCSVAALSKYDLGGIFIKVTALAGFGLHLQC